MLLYNIPILFAEACVKKIFVILLAVLIAGCATVYDIKEPQEITVRVRDFDTKAPLKNAKISVTIDTAGNSAAAKASDRGIGLTNADGVFYTDGFITENVTRFGAAADGYIVEWLDIDSFSPGGSYEFELKKRD